MKIYRLFRPFIFLLNPELAHNLALKYLKFFPNFVSLFSHPKNYENLQQNLFGLNFSNPVGMSAGFDKNAEIIKSLFHFGFGFVEAGTVTPLPQKGNPKPRIFRLKYDQAIINRLGFNNLGMDYFSKNIANFKKSSKQIIGINIGKNKDSIDFCADYLTLLEKFYLCADYITINISSPNTKNLRDIQNPENLNLLLEKINNLKINLKNQQHKNTPIFLKIAPDLDLEQLKSIAELSLQYEIDAVIISNTTIARNFNLLSTCQNEAGGLSGKPLFEKSTEILKQFYQLTEGKIPLIATGGISSKEDALLKIKNGASLIQIYSAFIYQGFGLVEEIKKYLSSELDKNNLQNISQLVGINHKF